MTSKPHSELVERIEFGLVPLDRHPDAVAALQSLVEQLEAAREALAHASRPGPYCKGGSLICEICVGSCGVEEYDELVESVTSNPAIEPLGPDPDGPTFPDEWGEFARGNA